MQGVQLLKKGYLSLILITAAFLFIFVGVFVGRNLVHLHTLPLPEGTIPYTQEDSYENGKININKAGVTELVQLPGIGEEIAKRIIAYRQENGPFSSVEDLLNISGIGPTRLKNIETYITVGG